MKSALVAVMIVVGVAACLRRPPPEPAQLLVVVAPDNATIRIDDRVRGRARTLRRRALALPPGKRYLTISAPGYFPHDEELDLVPGRTRVEIELRRIPE